jgi:apolipoprotein D and lipocalin family protein
LGLLFTVLFTGCTDIPDGLQPVSGFEVNRYLGRWYEIARLDHSFERGLSNVSADYSLKAGGAIRVVNRGFNERTAKWEQVEGTARFIADESTGSLKVSFFGPFYGGYHIIALDRANYAYAMITGPSRSYLWILARGTDLDKQTLSSLVSKAARWVFDTKGLILVKHDRTEN